MYTASHQEWDTVLDLHAAVVLDIERGNRGWSDSILEIESKVLAGALTKLKAKQGQKGSSRTSNSDKSSGPTNRSNSVMFCRQYQSGKCEKNKVHVGFVNGKKCTVNHICATCWLVEKTQNAHNECSTECKYHGKTLEEARQSFKNKD